MAETLFVVTLVVLTAALWAVAKAREELELAAAEASDEPRALAVPLYATGCVSLAGVVDWTLPEGTVVRRLVFRKGAGPGGGNVWLFETLFLNGVPVTWLPNTPWAREWELAWWVGEGARWCTHYSYERPKTREIRPQ